MKTFKNKKLIGKIMQQFMFFFVIDAVKNDMKIITNYILIKTKKYHYGINYQSKTSRI